MPDTALARAVAAYIAAWNCPDESARRALLEPAFATDGVYADPAVRLRGREALVAHSRRFADRWPGARITLTSAVDEHAGGACFTWAVVGVGGTTLREGFDVVEADDRGRLRRVTGFFGAYRSPHPPPDHTAAQPRRPHTDPPVSGWTVDLPDVEPGVPDGLRTPSTPRPWGPWSLQHVDRVNDHNCRRRLNTDPLSAGENGPPLVDSEGC